MPILALAVLALQIFIAVHICRTGQPRFWIFVVLCFPLIGTLIYFLVEILPNLQASDKVTRMEDRPDWRQRVERQSRARAEGSDGVHAGAVRHKRRSADGDAKPSTRREASVEPMRDKRAERDVTPAELIEKAINTGSVTNKLALADKCYEFGRYPEAIRLYESAREGFFVNAADILIGLARAHHAQGDFTGTRDALADLAAAHPISFAQERAILGARALADAGDLPAAQAAMEALLALNDHSLEARRLEARYFYAEILWKQGIQDRAQAELTDIVRHGKLFNMTEEEEHWVRRASEVQTAIS